MVTALFAREPHSEARVCLPVSACACHLGRAHTTAACASVSVSASDRGWCMRPADWRPHRSTPSLAAGPSAPGLIDRLLRPVRPGPACRIDEPDRLPSAARTQSPVGRPDSAPFGTRLETACADAAQRGGPSGNWLAVRRSVSQSVGRSVGLSKRQKPDGLNICWANQELAGISIQACLDCLLPTADCAGVRLPQSGAPAEGRLSNKACDHGGL
ncbi:unnamed protein product [Protopolystoma xenopodis]|uniref:Uncharacterized protein n=1 Tax=Protopolystoma xenopodis TaxID=117903 RepID=A0A448X2S8_9PLAT|nr:unnamed protein product [Protopolystoma xenopodis]